MKCPAEWVFSVMCSIHVRSPSIKLTALSVTSLVIIQHPRRAHSTLVASGNCRRYGRAVLRKRRINLNHKKQPLTLFFTFTTIDGNGRRGVIPAQICSSMLNTVHIYTDPSQPLLFTHLLVQFTHDDVSCEFRGIMFTVATHCQPAKIKYTYIIET